MPSTPDHASVFLHATMIDAVHWMTNNLLRHRTLVIPQDRRGIVLDQELDLSIPYMMTMTTEASCHTTTMDARASRTVSVLDLFVEFFDLAPTITPVLMRPALALGLKPTLKKLDVSTCAIIFKPSSVDREMQPLTIIESETRKRRHFHKANIYAPYEPLARPRVDLARCNIDVEPITIDDLPHDVESQPDVVELLNRVRSSADFLLTHDMRHDVLVARWSRGETTYDVGVRLR